jgi:hypothetical protein
METRRPYREAFLHDCDEENTYLHVHLDLAHSAGRKPKAVAILLREVFQQLAAQLHLRVVEGPESKMNLSRPSYACADAQAREVLFGGASLQATQTLELWKRHESQAGVMGVRVHFKHPKAPVQVGKDVDVGAKKRARFVRLFNTAWVKLLCAHGLLKGSPFEIDGNGDVVLQSEDNQTQQPQQTYTRRNSASKKRIRSHSDSDSSCSSGSEYDDDSEGEWVMPADCDSDSEATLNAQMSRLSWHTPMAATAKPLRSAMKKKTTGTTSATASRSVSFATTRKLVCVPFSVDERAARMAIGNTATFGNGLMKPLRSVRTGDEVWLDADLDCPAKRVRA